MKNNLHKEVSVLVKTFNRKKSLARLLRSLEKLQYAGPVLVADDSHSPYREEMLAGFPSLDLQYHTMPFDSGLSAGRNLLLRQINTPYLLLCDDDFCFDKRLDIPAALSLMDAHGLDIAGGILYNYITVTGIKRLVRVLADPRMAFRYISGQPSISRYAGHFSVADRVCQLNISNRQQASPVHTCDLVNNFFIGRTKSIRKINGWDESFKVGEHEDFFYRAKLASLQVALVEGLAARHYPGARKNYLSFRERSFELKRHFPTKFSFTTYREINTDTNTLLFAWTEMENLSTQPVI